LHHGDHLLAPALAGAPDHHHVGHGRVPGDGPLHLLDEDLLAAGVHGHRVAPEQLNLPVGQVAGRSPGME